MANGQGYWGLKSVIDANRADWVRYNQLPPDACPYDGSPLQVGKDNDRNCPMGDYRWKGGGRIT